MIEIESLDHLVLTVRDIETSIAFYETVLGMRRETFGEGRVSLHYGRQKINLHPHPTPIDLIAETAMPGTADLCFISSTPIEQIVAHLKANDVAIISGPTQQTGAEGPILSVYFRDPDNNLIEVSNRISRRS